MIKAAASGECGTMLLLIEKGADVDYLDDYGRNAYFYALMNKIANCYTSGTKLPTRHPSPFPSSLPTTPRPPQKNSDDSEHNEAIGDESEKKWFKQVWLWGMIAAICSILGGGGCVGVYFAHKNLKLAQATTNL